MLGDAITVVAGWVGATRRLRTAAGYLGHNQRRAMASVQHGLADAAQYGALSGVPPPCATHDQRGANVISERNHRLQDGDRAVENASPRSPTSPESRQ